MNSSFKLICLFLFSLSMIFSSCKKEPDEETIVSNDLILGTWASTYTKYINDVWVFNDNYSGSFTYTFETPVEEYAFTWKKEVHGDEEWFLVDFEDERKQHELGIHHFTLDTFNFKLELGLNIHYSEISPQFDFFGYKQD